MKTKLLFLIGITIFTFVNCSDSSQTTQSMDFPDCSNHGIFNKTTGECDCDVNWKGVDCSLEKRPFITKWKTDNPGVSGNTQITIPTISEGYNYSVDCDNDGIYESSNITESYTCNYDSSGTYIVRIKGKFPRIYLHSTWSSPSDNEKLISIEQWGDMEWDSMVGAFSGCKNLVINATDAPDLSNVTNLTGMFTGAELFNQPIEHWNMSNVTKLKLMFSGATSFNQPLNKWDVSNVTDMTGVFMEAKTFNQPLENWNVSKVKYMSNMFDSAESFNQPIGNWDVSNVTNMMRMFMKALSFDQPIGNWDVSKVENMEYMFYDAKSFNQPIGNWDVSKVTKMIAMFDSAIFFNQPIGDWDVSNVENMMGMFWAAESFNQPIGNWKVYKVKNMHQMFTNAISFDQSIGNWNVSSVTDFQYMFYNVTLSTETYDDILIGWSKVWLKGSMQFDAGNSTYCNGEKARQSILDEHHWIISDGGKNCE